MSVNGIKLAFGGLDRNKGRAETRGMGTDQDDRSGNRRQGIAAIANSAKRCSLNRHLAMPQFVSSYGR